MHENIRKLGILVFLYPKICFILLIYTSTLLISAEVLSYSNTISSDVLLPEENSIARLERQENYPFSLNGKFKRYVKTVPRKRAALLLDRIMVALQRAVDERKDTKMKGYYPETGVGLQRRDHDKGKVYWRCYFNAVTCF